MALPFLATKIYNYLLKISYIYLQFYVILYSYKSLTLFYEVKGEYKNVSKCNRNA